MKKLSKAELMLLLLCEEICQVPKEAIVSFEQDERGLSALFDNVPGLTPWLKQQVKEK